MKKPISQALFVIFLSSLIFACTGNVSKQEDLSPDQKEILGFLDELQQNWNSKDQAGFLALWNEKGRIMYSRDKIVVSKEEYAKILPERMEISPVMKLKVIDIEVTGNSAIAKTSARPNPNVLIKQEMKLVRENGKWLLMSWDY